MKTFQEVIEYFSKEVKINTGYSINNYKVKIVQKDDGDLYTQVTFPWWHQNDYVVRDILKTLNNLLAWTSDINIFLHDNKAVVHIYEAVCDPD